MNKYEKFNSYAVGADDVFSDDENILFDLKPKKIAFIINKLPFVLLWLVFDLIFVFSVFKYISSAFIWLLFVIIHIFPIWVWFVNIFSLNGRWKNTRYYITDKRIVIKNGFVGVDYRSIFYKDIANVHLRVGIIDRLLGVGDISFDVMGSISDGSWDTTLLDIENSQDVYNRLQKIISDNQIDTKYNNEIGSDYSIEQSEEDEN